ncbi:hypothetical protein [Micromonospora tulbaghiae]|uniref:hypothetical protein n=1 Tax=Micromonospora tulbaghiae TaxID=479978 RepID=UPI0033E035DC
MRFSQHFGIEATDQDDWFDPLLTMDTNLCVDSFLVFQDRDARWAPAHDHILDFFSVVFDLVRVSKGDEKSLAWRQAMRLLLFPEPSEFCLGVSESSTMGAGTGSGMQDGMLEGIRTAVGLGIDNVPHMEMLALFQGGMGLDRMSDATCNILKSYFIKYTQDVARRHGIATRRFRVRNASWSEQFARWNDLEVDLPANPFTKRPHPVLLVPRRFLRDIPVASADGFWSYAWRNYAEELRSDFNHHIARHVDRRQKAKMARQKPEIAAKYLQDLEQQKHAPYPLGADPKMVSEWWEAGGRLAEKSPLSYVPEDPDQFQRFVQTVLDSFRHSIEHQDGWQCLWSNKFPQRERVVQALFRSCVIHYCRSNGIVLTGESNAGRGPVDFKFSREWSAQALVEIKLMRNSGFWDGILEQTGKYAIAEEVTVAYFVAIAYEDSELTPEHHAKIRRAAQLSSEHHGITVIPIVVDARPKESASKTKAASSLRGRLHQVRGPQRDDGSDQAA